eukprot:3667945-Karenia_brevis.AAC.1
MHFPQTQLPLAYAMTVRKSQGLTMPKIYPSFIGICGFGMPYALMIRTRFDKDMISVGVPPSDAYHLLKDSSLGDEALWKSALESMVKVSEGFKIKGRDAPPYRGRGTQWSSLRDVLQGGQKARLRIQYYKHIATKLMTASGVN